MADQPPPFDANVYVTKRFRFGTQAADTTVVIKSGNLLDIVNVATAANAASRLFTACRIRKVEMWAPAASSGQQVTVAIYPGVNVNSPAAPRIECATVIGTARTAHVKWTPLPDEPTGFWQNASSASAGQSLFELDFPEGAIVDVTLDLVLALEATQAVQNAPSGATAGQIYYRSLDGIAQGSSPQFYPVGPMPID
jgi:hypothetical protein